MFLFGFNFNRLITKLTIEIFTHLYYLDNERMTNAYNDSVNAIRTNPKVRVKINDMLDRYSRLPLIYQSKIGCDTLIQNVVLKEKINTIGAAITDLDIDLKVKISRIKYLENSLF